MKVILTQDIKSIGKKGQVINASDGYARHYLLPKKLAVIADNTNLNELKTKQDANKYRRDMSKASAEELSKKMKDFELVFKIKAGENGKTFGSVTSKDIADELDGLPQEKMHCSVMGHEALEDALKKYYGKDNEEWEDLAGNTHTGDKVVCTCFNVTESQIWEAIKVNGLKTVEEVTNYTKAGGACGRCRGVIKDMIDTYLEKEGKAPVLTATQKILKISKVIEQQISPELQKDGGDIELIDIDGNTVKVKLSGMCSGCKNASMTIKGFVESVLRDKVDSAIVVEQV